LMKKLNNTGPWTNTTEVGKPEPGIVLRQTNPAEGCGPRLAQIPPIYLQRRGFIFLSQRCDRKTNTAKPLEPLPAWARCRGDVGGVCPPRPRKTPPALRAQLRTHSGLSPTAGSPRGLPKTPRPRFCAPKPLAPGFCPRAEGMGNQELVVELLLSRWLRCQGFQPYPKGAHIQD